MKKGIVLFAHLADELNVFSLNVPHNQYLHLGEEVQGHVIYCIPEGRRKGGGEVGEEGGREDEAGKSGKEKRREEGQCKCCRAAHKRASSSLCGGAFTVFLSSCVSVPSIPPPATAQHVSLLHLRIDF